MKFSKSKQYQIFFFIFLTGISQGNTILQFASIGILGFFGLFFIKTNKAFFPFKDLFYASLIIISSIQLLLFYKDDYSLYYILNSIISTVMWVLMMISSIVMIRLIKILTIKEISDVLILFFKLNLALIVFQYIGLVIEYQSIIPFVTNMGAGDSMKGVFTNSSVNMIVLSFYAVYFFYKRNPKLALIAIISIICTTFMSGMVLFLGTCVFFAFLYLPYKYKVRVILCVFIGILAFSIISPKNVDYVKSNLTKKLFAKSDQARKIVSFEQTFDYAFEDPSNFLVGAGGGKFSSRTAFMTAGEYVDWFPKKLSYSSESFHNNHFQLWNSKILSIPYKDGTANQPFSFYNKILGEYGFIGVLLFLMFYLYYPLKYYKLMSYGKLLILLMLSYFVLDYWFEYFTIVIFFELFFYLDVKELKYEKD